MVFPQRIQMHLDITGMDESWSLQRFSTSMQLFPCGVFNVLSYSIYFSGKLAFLSFTTTEIHNTSSELQNWKENHWLACIVASIGNKRLCFLNFRSSELSVRQLINKLRKASKITMFIELLGILTSISCLLLAQTILFCYKSRWMFSLMADLAKMQSHEKNEDWCGLNHQWYVLVSATRDAMEQEEQRLFKWDTLLIFFSCEKLTKSFWKTAGKLLVTVILLS